MALEVGWAQRLDPRIAVLGHRSTWRRRFAVVAAVGDFLVALLIMALVVALYPDATAAIAIPSLALALVWLAVAAAARCYDWKLFGEGVEEYRRVAVTGLAVVGVAGVLGTLTNPIWARVALLGLILTTPAVLIWRRVLRGALHRARRSGKGMNRTLLVGAAERVKPLVRSFNSGGFHGTEVVAALLTDGQPQDFEAHLDQVGVGTDIAGAAKAAKADQVILIGALDTWNATELRDLMWALADEDIGLLVAPVGESIAVPRLNVRPVDGLSLLHVAQPQISGLSQSVKSGLDRIIAFGGLLVLAPVLLTIAIVVRATSPGPAVFRQTRVGRNGEPFIMYKFRSMVPGAESLLIDLRDKNEHTDTGTLFKIKQDPRVTPVGRFLRRYSLDELPQLVNVLKGDMSLVGPRPPLPEEVANYSRLGRFRMTVRPGLTGLWQVSGRSDLGEAESMELDLRYVENWNLMLDAGILWKTGRAVFKAEGAY